MEIQKIYIQLIFLGSSIFCAILAEIDSYTSGWRTRMPFGRSSWGMHDRNRRPRSIEPAHDRWDYRNLFTVHLYFSKGFFFFFPLCSPNLRTKSGGVGICLSHLSMDSMRYRRGGLWWTLWTRQVRLSFYDSTTTEYCAFSTDAFDKCMGGTVEMYCSRHTFFLSLVGSWWPMTLQSVSDPRPYCYDWWDGIDSKDRSCNINK